MQNSIQNIIVIGNWGVGKSEFIRALTAQLATQDGIVEVKHDSDRLHFEDVVRRDTRGRSPSQDGYIYGNHSVLKQDGAPGHMQFMALDGSIFNQSHRCMIRGLRQPEKAGVVRIIEYATGPNRSYKSGEPFNQSAHFLVNELVKNNLVPKTLVVELSAPFSVRKDRNVYRGDTVDAEAFDLYGQAGGAMERSDEIRLMEHFIHIENQKGIVLDEVARELTPWIHALLTKDTKSRGPEGLRRGKERR